MAIEDNASDLNQDFALLDSNEGEVQEQEIEEKETSDKKTPPKTKEDEPEKEEIQEEIKEYLPHERPTMEAIKKVYPDLFKKFPTLQAAFNRERQFSEIFHTPTEAQETARVAQDYESLRDDVVNGDGSKFIPALKESESLGKFAKSFLPNLYKADKDVHWKVILPVMEDIVRVAYRTGIDSGNENLSNSALHMAKYLLGDSAVAEGKKTFVEREEPKTDNSVKEERQKFENERFNSFNIDVHESLYNSLISEIDKGFKSDDGLTKFMKDSIRKAAIDQVVQAVKNDKEFVTYKDKLWKEAKSNGYKGDDKTRIINASLARAKSLIPSIRRRLIGEALGSSPLEAEKRREKLETTASRKEPGSQGREGINRARVPSSKKIDFRKTSDMDILNDNYTLKGQK